MVKYAVVLVVTLLLFADKATAQSPDPQVHDSLDSAFYDPRANNGRAFLASIAEDSAGASKSQFRLSSADLNRDGLLEGAIVGGVAGGVVGVAYFRGWSAFGSESPGGKETIVGIVLGGALGASLGMLIDSIL